MKNLSVKTLLSCLKASEDYELYPYAKKKLTAAYGEDITDTICGILLMKEQNGEMSANARHELVDSMNLSGRTETEISKLLEDIDSTIKEKRMPMSAIMEMFRAESVPLEEKSDEGKFLDKKSKEYIVINFGRYVHSLINRMYSTYAEKMEDELYQCGIIGLMKALPVYDESKGAFTTLCKPFVMHEITTQINFVHNDTTLHYNALQKKINDAVRKLSEDGMEPTVHRISIITEIRPEIVERELKCMECTKFFYLDAEQDDKDGTDKACEYEDTPEAIYARKERTECIFASIKNLPEGIRQVIALRYEGARTNEEIAKELHIKIGQVKSYYQRGLRLMRQDPGLRRLFPEYLSDAEREMLKYSMPISAPKRTIDNEIDDLLSAMGTLSDAETTDDILDSFDAVIESLRA